MSPKRVKTRISGTTKKHQLGLLEAHRSLVLPARHYVLANEKKLTSEQESVCKTVMDKVLENKGGLVFIDAAGGTGKTFTINMLLAKVRQVNKVAIAVASTGVAAALLHYGFTAHSAFKLPLNISSSTAECDIITGSEEEHILKKVSCIVWDECTMMHKNAFEAVDRLLRKVRHNKRIMGGVTVVLSGDFHQLLPVISRRNVTMEEVFESSIKCSYLWTRIEKHTLSINMRVILYGDPASGNFSKLLMQVGDGTLPSVQHDNTGPHTTMINLPMELGTVVASEEELIRHVYPTLTPNKKYWFSERAILATTNAIVNRLNNELLSRLRPNEEAPTEYKSIDDPADEQACNSSDTISYLNRQQPQGMPPHILRIKLGCPLILLRNIDVPRLCNGTRLMVVEVAENFVRVQIESGPGIGETVNIVKHSFYGQDRHRRIKFTRLQFPLALSYAITVHKAQGQTLKCSGVHLRDSPGFTHGQTYVALSRVGSGKNQFVLPPISGLLHNIVYTKALQ